MSEYRKLARLAARALYKHTYALERKSALARDNAAKNQSSSMHHHHHFGRRMTEFPGLVEIVVDALTRRQWIREDDLAHALKLNPKQLRRVLRHLESLRVLTRSHVKERQALKEQRLVERGVTEEEAAQAVEKKTASWCCLDYARLVDTLRYALRGVKVELERLIDGGTFEESYVCKNREECAKRFSALDTARLFDAKRGGFVCDTCGTDVVRAGEENDGEDGNNGGGDPNATDGVIAKESKQALKLKMKRFSDQIAGIERQIAKCLRYPAPSYGTLQEYVVAKKRTKEAKEAAAMGQSGGQGYWGSIGVARGTQAFEQRLEETTFEIQIGDENGENGDKMNKGGAGDGQEKKEMPEWITRELQVDEEGKQTKKRKVEGADDAEKAKETTDEDAVQEQYAKALLAALQAQQRDTTEQAEAKAEDAREKEEGGGGADVEMKADEEAGGGDEEEEEEWEEA